MGLDSVELVLEFEESFGIEIPDKDAEILVTAGKIHEYICDKCNAQTVNSCATQKVFYLFRKAFSKLLNINKRTIHPKTNIRDISETISPNNLWRFLSQDTSLKLPTLKLSKWMKFLIIFLSLLATSSLSYSFIVFSETHAILSFKSIISKVWGALILWVFLYLIFARLAAPFRNVIPAEYQTVGNLSKKVVALNVKYFEPLSKQEIWDILVSIISEQLGVEKEVIKPESHLVNDFGLN